MADLQQAEAVLREAHGDRVCNWCFGDFGRHRNTQGRCVIVRREAVQNLLNAVRQRLPDGLVAWIGTSRWLGEGMENLSGHVELAVAPANSQFEIPRYAGTSDVNGRLETESLIEKLKSWHESFGISIEEAATDSLTFRLVNRPADVEALASEVYGLCPVTGQDLDKRGQAIHELAKEIEGRGTVSLRWD